MIEIDWNQKLDDLRDSTHKAIDESFIKLSLKVNEQWEFYAMKFLCYRLSTLEPHMYYPTLDYTRKMILGFIPGVYEVKIRQCNMPIELEVRVLCGGDNKIIKQTMLLNVKELFKYIMPVGLYSTLEWVSMFRLIITIS